DDAEDSEEAKLYDGRAEMSKEEVKALEMSVKPVRLALDKLRKAAHAIKKSTTIILPEWYAILDRMAQASKEKGKQPLSTRIMPRDVTTRWNYTYEMLDFAYTYRDAYNQVTANQ
ncbi:hypothetical protein BDZ97DRAFT_1601526, partial [Flammula alnicola]